MNGVAKKVYDDMLKTCMFVVSTLGLFMSICAVEDHVFGSTRLKNTGAYKGIQNFLNGGK
ncbi:MAG: hypothetical protein ACI4PR_03520 [Acutalibacteraceae bacterium]